MQCQGHRKVDAEYEGQDRAKPLVPSEWTAMRQVLEKKYGQMDEKVTPAEEYAEKKLADGEYRAPGGGGVKG